MNDGKEIGQLLRYFVFESAPRRSAGSDAEVAKAGISPCTRENHVSESRSDAVLTSEVTRLAIIPTSAKVSNGGSVVDAL